LFIYYRCWFFSIEVTIVLYSTGGLTFTIFVMLVIAFGEIFYTYTEPDKFIVVENRKKI
jgi:hypothetical protein